MCVQDARLQEQFRQHTGPNAGTLPTGPDPKWRYLWRVGPRPECTQFEELNAEPVVPQVRLPPASSRALGRMPAASIHTGPA